MFCKNCGKEIEDNSNFCIYCGADLTEKPSYDQQWQQNQQPRQEQSWQQSQQEQQWQPKSSSKINVLGIVGFIVSLLSLWLGLYFCIACIVGVVLSAIGVAKSKEFSSCNGLAIAGLVIGIIALVFWGIVWMSVGLIWNDIAYL